jgi:hypothetical protein
VTVHYPAGREGGERTGGEEDRRPQTEDPLDAGDDDQVVVATATTSWMVPERQVSVADRSSVLRRTG